MTGADPEGGFGDLSPLNFWKCKLLKMFIPKRSERRRGIFNIILKKTEKTRFALKFFGEIRTETHI